YVTQRSARRAAGRVQDLERAAWASGQRSRGLGDDEVVGERRHADAVDLARRGVVAKDATVHEGGPRMGGGCGSERGGAGGRNRQGETNLRGPCVRHLALTVAPQARKNCLAAD